MPEPDYEIPSWLANADLEPRPPTTRSQAKKAPKRKLAAALKKAGVTIITKDDDRNGIVAFLDDPDESDWDTMKSWIEGRGLSVTGKLKRDAFVLEFLIDFNGPLAATRAGVVGEDSAFNFWRSMMRCPYVQRLISAKMSEWEAATVVTRNSVIAVFWREANDYIHGNAASRVSAARELAKIMGYSVDTVNINLNAARDFIDEPLKVIEFEAMDEALERDF
jgi:hypothetical protein